MLCSKHAKVLKPDDCNACAKLSRMVHSKVLAQISETPGLESEVPSAAQRFCRSDEKPPTLTLSPASMDLAEKVFKLGRYKIPRYFEELTREFLFLPHDQNETLNSNLIMESFF